jgi:hypothetical protein
VFAPASLSLSMISWIAPQCGQAVSNNCFAVSGPAQARDVRSFLFLVTLLRKGDRMKTHRSH